MPILLPILFYSAHPHIVPYYSQCCGSVLFHVMMTENYHIIHTEAKRVFIWKNPRVSGREFPSQLISQ